MDAPHRAHNGSTAGGTSSIVLGDASAGALARHEPLQFPADGSPDTLPMLKLRIVEGVVKADSLSALKAELQQLMGQLGMNTAVSDASNGQAQAGGTQGMATGGMEGANRAPGPLGGPVDQKSQSALEKLKFVLKKRGCSSIIGMGIRFRAMDDNGNKQIDAEEFQKAMTELDIEKDEAEALFKYFDEDMSGSINFDEFIQGIAPPPNQRRRKMIMEAYKVFDVDGDGKVTVVDLMRRYDASQHPDVMGGTKSEGEVMRELLDVFDSREKDGVVTAEEFLAYYQKLGASIDDDDYFELVIRNAWHISGGEGWCANTTCRRVLVTHPDGHQTVEEITNDIDIDKLDREEMMANLKARGIDAAAIAVTSSPIETGSELGGPPSEPLPTPTPSTSRVGHIPPPLPLSLK